MLTQARDIIRNAASPIGVILAETLQFLDNLIPFFLLGAALIVTDLRWGIAAAKRRGERVRHSRAVRRTANKMIDYFLWTVLAGMISVVYSDIFITKAIPFVIMGIIYAIELDSVFSNYAEARNKKYLIRPIEWLKNKFNVSAGIEERQQDEDTKVVKGTNKSTKTKTKR